MNCPLCNNENGVLCKECSDKIIKETYFPKIYLGKVTEEQGPLFI